MNKTRTISLFGRTIVLDMENPEHVMASLADVIMKIPCEHVDVNTLRSGNVVCQHCGRMLARA